MCYSFDVLLRHFPTPFLLATASLTLAVLPVAGVIILPVNLGTSGDFTVLAKTAITSTGATMISGDVGISPEVAGSITGFGLSMDGSDQFATSSIVNGRVFAADYAPPTPAKLTTAVSDMEAAYTEAAGRLNPDFLNYQSGLLDGQTLTPGLYKWTSGVKITNSITLDGGGASNAVWIFQIDNRLELASFAQILLTNGAVSDNIFWQAAEGATLEPYSHFEGNLLTMTDIAAQDGATMDARLLSQTAVTLIGNTIIPEPSTYAAIMGLTVLGLVCLRRRRKSVNA